MWCYLLLACPHDDAELTESPQSHECILPADEVVALKKLKMEKEKEGFPITSLREVCCLLKASHPNIVHVRVSQLRF